MSDPLLHSKEIKLCNSDPDFFTTEEWKQIRNEIALSEDGYQMKNEFAIMVGDGNHISENSSLVNLVTVFDGDCDVQRIPSENALIQHGHQSDELEKIPLDEKDKFKGYKLKQFQSLDAVLEGKSDENVSLISNENITDFNYTEIDLKRDRMAHRTISLESLNSSDNSSLGTIQSKASVISENLVSVPLQTFEGENVIHKRTDEEINNSNDSLRINEKKRKPCVCFSWCFPFRLFQRVNRKSRFTTDYFTDTNL